MRIILTIILAVLIGGGGVYTWLYYGGFAGEKDVAIAFIDAYGEYDEIALHVEALTHLPGTEGNADRAELQSLLETVLTHDVTPERRDVLARLAFQNLDTLKKEVDAAQSAQAKLYQNLQQLDNVGRQFEGVQLRTQAGSIVTHARKRAELSARITSVLSETQDQTHAIITQILEDKGELTSAHIQAINSATAEAENRHDGLEGLYTEVLQEKKDIETAFTQFIATAL